MMGKNWRRKISLGLMISSPLVSQGLQFIGGSWACSIAISILIMLLGLNLVIIDNLESV